MLSVSERPAFSLVAIFSADLAVRSATRFGVWPEILRPANISSRACVAASAAPVPPRCKAATRCFNRAISAGRSWFTRFTSAVLSAIRASSRALFAARTSSTGRPAASASLAMFASIAASLTASPVASSTFSLLRTVVTATSAAVGVDASAVSARSARIASRSIFDRPADAGVFDSCSRRMT